MQPAKGVLIDLGGVVYQGNRVIPGSVEAVRRLQDAGVPFRFLTNTTSQPRSKILEKLNGLGIATKEDHVFTPALAARTYLADHKLNPVFLVKDSLKEDFINLPRGEKPALVVGDAGDSFTYQNLNDAFRVLEQGAEFIALASNRYFTDGDGKRCLDVGAFVAALEYASGKKAVVLGKPSQAFFHLAASAMGLEPEGAVMIGDDAEFDVIAAIEAGLMGYLVHTGKWSPGSLSGLKKRPTAEFEDLTEAVGYILGN